jgi:hypothetical protein
MTTETLKFKIGLSGTFWDKRPAFSVSINDNQIVEDTIASADVQYIEFTANVNEDSVNKLVIKLLNKTDADTLENEDKTAIINDMLLNIKSVEIDDINLGPMIWSASKFIPEDSSRPEMANCIDLGWNGSYIIEFNSPFYLWLLENM